MQVTSSAVRPIASRSSSSIEINCRNALHSCSIIFLHTWRENIRLFDIVWLKCFSVYLSICMHVYLSFDLGRVTAFSSAWRADIKYYGFKWIWTLSFLPTGCLSILISRNGCCTWHHLKSIHTSSTSDYNGQQSQQALGFLFSNGTPTWSAAAILSQSGNRGLHRKLWLSSSQVCRIAPALPCNQLRVHLYATQVWVCSAQ